MQHNGNKLIANLYDVEAPEKIRRQVIGLLRRQFTFAVRPVVVLCIGSDRYTGDVLGPLTGTFLEKITGYPIFGTMDNPVHAGNLQDAIQEIYRQYDDPVIVAVDACLGTAAEVGNIEVWEGGIQAGSAVGKRLPCIGHISLAGVVNSEGIIGVVSLQSTSLSLVMKISKVISVALQAALYNIAGTLPADEALIGKDLVPEHVDSD